MATPSGSDLHSSLQVDYLYSTEISFSVLAQEPNHISIYSVFLSTWYIFFEQSLS